MTGKRTRRQALQVVAGSVPALPILGQHTHGTTAAAKAAAPYSPKALTPDQFATLRALVDAIIPRTDTPGASDARVHEAIDRLCVKEEDLRKRVTAGLDRLAAATFAELDEARRIDVLQPMSDSADPFFRLMKNHTIDAYYASREGLQQELGWNANTYLPEFKGCTHPEHQG